MFDAVIEVIEGVAVVNVLACVEPQAATRTRIRAIVVVHADVCLCERLVFTVSGELKGFKKLNAKNFVRARVCTGFSRELQLDALHAGSTSHATDDMGLCSGGGVGEWVTGGGDGGLVVWWFG